MHTREVVSKLTNNVLLRDVDVKHDVKLIMA